MLPTITILTKIGAIAVSDLPIIFSYHRRTINFQLEYIILTTITRIYHFKPPVMSLIKTELHWRLCVIFFLFMDLSSVPAFAVGVVVHRDNIACLKDEDFTTSRRWWLERYILVGN